MKLIIQQILLFVTLFANAQPKPYGPQPTAGKPMPDFTLEYITHYSAKSASLKDFQGKWLFLDFWFTGCVVCIRSFPKVSQLQQEFQGKIIWVMVGLNDSKTSNGANIEEFYEKIRAKQNLEIPAAYDSVLAVRWGVHSMPHVIVVDPGGIVHSITSGADITKEKIKNLLDGKPVSFLPKDREYHDFNPDDY